MTPRTLLKTILFLILTTSYLQAQNYFFVQDPQNWASDQGTIEEAQFTIHPRGVYMEVGMYLTLSAGDTRLSRSNALIETNMNFTLPEGSMVVDSWLWINDYVVRADIKDRWTASAIYNEIVGRRQDPSLLTKNGNNSYHLQVYPLKADSTRRVKVTYLVPGNWEEGAVSIPLPVELLKTSGTPLDKIQVQAFLNNDFKAPRIEQLADVPFRAASHATLGSHVKMDITGSQLKSALDFKVDVPMENGVYLSHFEGKEDNYYQLVLLPSKVFPLRERNAKKVAVLLDYQANNSSVTKEEVIDGVESRLIQTLADQDSFNVFLSQTDIAPISREWLPADDATIKAHFDQIRGSDLATFSNLPNLLFKGINYIKDQGTGGDLLIVSSANQIAEPEVANGYLEELTDLMGTDDITVYVNDYQNENQRYYWINGVNYMGNEYFYANITRLTNGSLNTIREHQTFNNTTKQAMADVIAVEGIIDIHTSLSDGFCYGRYDVGNTRSFSSIGQPLLQVGKYQGEFPFQVEASGVIGGNFFGEKIEIASNAARAGSEMDKIIWAGNYIQDLEQDSRSNSVVKEIVEWSLANRVLSYFTAFLALEVELGGVACEDCVDETNLNQLIVDTETEPTRPDPESEIVLPTENIGDTFEEDGIASEPVGAPAGPTGGGGAAGDFGNEVLTATAEVLADSLVHITASPNPFSEQTTITVQLGKEIDANQVGFTIYGINGQKIRTFTSLPNTENRYQFTWDGTATKGQPVAKGMYIFNVRTEQGQKHLKLLYLK